jgi:hypothetical protein
MPHPRGVEGIARIRHLEDECATLLVPVEHERPPAEAHRPPHRPPVLAIAVREAEEVGSAPLCR